MIRHIFELFEDLTVLSRKGEEKKKRGDLKEKRPTSVRSPNMSLLNLLLDRDGNTQKHMESTRKMVSTPDKPGHVYKDPWKQK